MISGDYDLNEFIGKVRDQDLADVILMAIDETTAAERYYLKNHRSEDPVSEKCHTYAEQLKMLIDYLRYGVRSSGIPRGSIRKLNLRKAS